jgi:phytoene/squalene synthetase
MAFDAGRRGRLVSAAQLARYTRLLGSAVTEALHHFIGHGCAAPRDESRYQAVEAAHITHMLRDTLDDARAGYYNIPSDYVLQHRIDPGDVDHPAYRAWVAGRVELARTRFEAGRKYLARVQNLRCRLAGFAYAARFEAVLDTIEKDEFRLRADYHEMNVAGTLWSAAASLFRPVSRNARRPRSSAGAGRVGLESPAVRKP